MEGDGRGLVLKLIAHAVVSGGLRAEARRIPEAARGLIKAADFHSARVRALADEILARRMDVGSVQAGRRA